MSERWRRLALYLLLFSIVGVLAELYFLEHFEDRPQWIPVVLLGVGVIVGGWVATTASRAAVRALQTLMGLYLISGGLGIFLHLKSNVEFELELHPDVGGMELLMESLSGAMPALAPGTMVQIGLLGLLVCFRHPALGGDAGNEEGT